MLDKFRLRVAWRTLCDELKLSELTHAMLDDSTNPSFQNSLLARKRNGFDIDQTLLFFVSDGIVRAADNGALVHARRELPEIYSELVRLWRWCGDKILEDDGRYGMALNIHPEGNPFDVAIEPL